MDIYFSIKGLPCKNILPLFLKSNKFYYIVNTIFYIPFNKVLL